jgi:branched-chain amino acid transport system substrate-binding protein
LIYNSENTWAAGCKQAVSDAVVKVNGANFVREPISVLDSTDNFSSAILSLKDAQDDLNAIYVCLMGRQAGLFVKQAVDNGLQANFYGTDSFSQQEFIDNAGEAASQALFVMPAASKSDKYQQFADKYQALYGEQADTVAAKAYDAVKVIAAAIKQVGELDSTKLRDTLKTITVEGVTGENAFDENGDLRHAEYDPFTYSGSAMVKLTK